MAFKNHFIVFEARYFHSFNNFQYYQAVADCTDPRAKTGVLKALIALAKHHPKLVCTEMLATNLPFQRYFYLK